jgi:hypothetical protein
VGAFGIAGFDQFENHKILIIPPVEAPCGAEDKVLMGLVCAAAVLVVGILLGCPVL